MKKFRTIFLMAAVTVLAVLALGGCKPKGVKLGKLYVDGTSLYMEGFDQAFAFEGISYGWHNLWPRFYNGESLTNLLRQTGKVMYRAAIGSDDFALEWNPGCDHGYLEDKELALKCFDALAESAIENGVFLIADWHSHITHLDEAKEFFTYVATKYADCPNIIYELFNEPVCFSFEEDRSYADLGNPEAMKSYWQHLKLYSEELIETITSISTVHPLILVGCPSWDQRIDLPAEDPITTYDNIMYTVHFYAGTHKKELRDACDAALEKGIPIFISECAACDATGDGEMDLESWKEWNDWALSNKISTLLWSIGDKNETCSFFTPEASSEGPWAESVVKPWPKAALNWKY
jgi:Cellulase (glycosyl hydrolase family 5).